MKKIACLGLALIIVLAFIGCSASKSNNMETSDRFIVVYSDFSNKIYADKETNVLYFWHCGGYSGGLSVMLDKNGKPLLWEETNE